jgi:spore maturation protein CgeB
MGARKVAPLYGSVDPDLYRHVAPQDLFRADFSYMGTYAADRQAALQELFIKPAWQLPAQRFVIGGAQYPQEFPWSDNIFFLRHLPPADHPAFFSSSRLTLNVTRDTMKTMGWCPSGRLFEASACGTPIVSDMWSGLDEFFTPNEEILIARDTGDTLNALQLSDAELARIASAARERTLAEHSAARRAEQLEQLLEGARQPEVAAA